MKNIISFFPKEKLDIVADFFRENKKISISGSGNSSSKSMIVSDILRNNNLKGPIIWIVSEKEEQNKIKKAIKIWSDFSTYIYKKRDKEEILNFPSAGDFKQQKHIELMEFVYRVSLREKAVFIISFEDILQNFPDMSFLNEEKIVLKKGEKLDEIKFIEKIVSMGYEISEDKYLKKGQYFRIGDVFNIFPINSEEEYQINFEFGKIEKIYKNGNEVEGLDIFLIEIEDLSQKFLNILPKESLIIDDEVDVMDESFDVWNSFLEASSNKFSTVSFTSFNDDVKNHKHLHFLSVLKYRNAYDLSNDLRDKIKLGWKIFIFTKKEKELNFLLKDQSIPFLKDFNKNNFGKSSVFLIKLNKEDVLPQSFQTPTQKLSLITDLDLTFLREEKRKDSSKNIFDDFLTSLKTGDYVVHADHGIAKFLGLDKKTVDDITKEYLKLGYAENDKLYVPIDQADKINKYIGSVELMPKLTRLGSAEWNTVSSRVKKETQQIAKELLKLYAERKAAKGIKFGKDTNLQEKFEKTFPYEETPGQIKAINDAKEDMERSFPMDRLVCGDVGFGKTEVAMRAAFKAVQEGKQVVVISPITILADQHYKSFSKRMEKFHIRVEMLSRFKNPKEQKEILEKMKKGEIDIVIGTHRLLQPDIGFKKLGLLIVDEEQRFGVKQKETLKSIKKDVDVLTLTATPIPRTLNICLNKLRDITTITTPPFGRLPIITEVRKYSSSLVREAILKEIERKGQVYVLHNRVQTINSFADKLRELIPEARICIAHGQLGSGDLEKVIMDFKDYKYDVLVSSTIIENGIDLANANTLIVNNAEKFGLSQLYQLRGRVGRGKNQAYAYFLYHGQRLKLDAKKRLRAIVEASDLGSGFQIAMKDLEIRGAGDVLGANQHGVINVVGMAHFMRMLNKAVEDLKAGRIIEGEEEISDVSIELPVPAYIPDFYIPNSKEKINTYQKLSSVDDKKHLEEIRHEVVEDFGKMPMEVNNLFKIIELKIDAKIAGLLNVKSEVVPMSKDKEIVLHMSKKVRPANIINLLEYNSKWQIVGARLRINIKELGTNWFKELQVCIQRLGKEAKHGKKGER